MDIERNLGDQPLTLLMSKHGLKPTDLVEASTEQLTHKMVTRAMKGRRLTPKTMGKVVRAMGMASGSRYPAVELFNYNPKPERDEASESAPVDPNEAAPEAAADSSTPE